ncbi:MAG TPA: AAA family ATPase [Tepidisphaeraceae bacterium]|nr:AAA family ATPase [Tepidisphaeraceae bacterium]
MTHEMQLAHAAGLPVAGQDMAYAQSSSAASKLTGLRKIHRLLRGRYPLVITLGLIFGIAGALVGYFTQKPLFSSKGEVLIDPTIQSPGSYGGEAMSSYSLFLESQIRVIESNGVIQRALDEDEWKDAGGMRGGDPALAHFIAGLEVENIPNTAILRITYSDPDAKLAFAGAEALMKAYREFFQDEDPMMFTGKLQELERLRTKYTNDLQNDEAQLSDLQKVYGTDDLTSYQSTHMEELAQLTNKLDDAKTRLDIDERLVGDTGAGATTRSSPMTEDQIAAFDGGTLNQMRRDRDQIQRKMELMKEDGYGSEAPAMKYLHSQLDVMNDQIESYVASMSQSNRLSAGPSGQYGFTPVKAEIVGLKVEIEDLTKQFDHQKQLCDDIGRNSNWIRQVKNDIQQAQTSLDSTNAEDERLISLRNLNSTHQMKPISEPVLAEDPSTDRRKVFGALGFIGGAALPTLAIMLISLLDGRFRYSDEANSDLGGIPLLGILPNLPDLLTDPTQAATAAHCVHQIRTILQITAHSSERRVFAVTSGSPGDGKTSLTLALGLSFAASGSRTLLVDGDLIGGGLTARLNVTAEHGVLEAMAARDITPFIRTTDVADLSFLPVGKAMGGYTGTISPAAVRRLVDEARKQFDVILIDTGPILGSIEASPVAVASDGVVLCVSRGQQRQLVDRALAHLHAIGARLAGVVFNRAQSQDFERSTNRLGLGSIPAGTDGRRSEAIGPVARAVASSVRSAASGQDR